MTEQIRKVVVAIKNKGFKTFDPINNKINWWFSEFEENLSLVNVKKEKYKLKIIIEFLENVGLDIYFKELNMRPGATYQEVRLLLFIDYFLKHRLYKKKEAMEFSYSGDDRKLEDFVIKKYELIQYNAYA